MTMKNLWKIFFLRNPIHPNSNIKKIWGLINFFALLFFIFFIPLYSSFNALNVSNYMISPFLVFFFNIFFQINTAFNYQGTLITEKSKILQKYFKNEFFIDLLTLTPFIVNNFFLDIGFMNYLFIIRLTNIQHEIKLIEEEYFQFSNKTQGYFDLIKLFLYILISAHICACIWYYVGFSEFERGVRNNWLVLHNLTDSQDVTKVYIESLYYSILAMSTVGTVNAFSTIEKMVSIVLILILASVFAYSLNSVGMILDFMFKSDVQLK